MNEHGNDAGGVDNNGLSPAEDREVDGELVSVGQALRDSADPSLISGIVSSSAERKVVVLRRNNRILAVAAAVLAIAMLGSVAWAGTRRTGHQEAASGASLSGPSTAAEKLVAGLPAKPIDPHSVKLVSTVSRFGDCDALANQLRKVGAAHVGSQGFGASYGFLTAGYSNSSARFMANDDAVGVTAASAPASGSAGRADEFAQGMETLGTNVIVDGVDEPDSIKAVGKLVVEINGNYLRIVDTSAGRVASTLNLGVGEPKNGRFAGPNSLLVEGSKVVVFGTESVQADAVKDDPSASRPSTSYLTITFVDITDPATPKVTQRVRIEGNLVSARRVGESVRIVTSSSLNDLPMVFPATANGVRPALHQNRLAVAESSVDDWIPEWDTGPSTKASRLEGCGDVIVPDTFAGVEMTSLVQFGLSGQFEPKALGLLAPSEDLTATASAAVIASHVWVDPASQTGSFKDWSTALHRFTFTDSGPEYVGSGQVPGSIRDDFSLAVLDDTTTGVVTVEGVPWSVDQAATITVRTLVNDPSKKSLNPAGSIVPAGSSHGVSGLRFMGNRLLISSGPLGKTLSSVDLSSPTTPKDLGSVELPGSGTYFHPLGNGRVLVIGDTLRMEGQRSVAGMHTTLLDITGAPREITHLNAELISSSVGYDHHAFTWWARRSIAAMGVYIQRPGAKSTSEAILLNVTDSALKPKFARPKNADLGPKCPANQVNRAGCDDSGDPVVNRVLVVDGAPWLYTTESVERLDPTTFASTNLVPLKPLR